MRLSMARESCSIPVVPSTWAGKKTKSKRYKALELENAFHRLDRIADLRDCLVVAIALSRSPSSF